jgi:hypothetical protein
VAVEIELIVTAEISVSSGLLLAGKYRESNVKGAGDKVISL